MCLSNLSYFTSLMFYIFTITIVTTEYILYLYDWNLKGLILNDIDYLTFMNKTTIQFVFIWDELNNDPIH